MSHIKPSSKLSNNQVDWNDPRLEALLRKTDGWKLDNRGAFQAQDVQIHLGWGANTSRSAILVWESDRVMVIETRFLIRQGEHVRVDRVFGSSIRTAWGVVAEGRQGFREDDKLNGVFVHWLHMC